MQDWIWIAGGVVLGVLALYVLLRIAVRALRRKILINRHGDPEMVDTILSGQIARGMTLEMVLDAWGDPADMDEVVMKTKTKRELKYDQKGKNRFGTRVYFENGLVVGWETK